MAALLVAMSVMAIALTVAVPVWQTAARREREAELIFRGEQYAHAIALFQRKYANTLPPSIDVLLNERFLRKKYLDPITGEEFQLLGAGSVPPAGVPGAGDQARPGLGQPAQETGGLPGATGRGGRGLGAGFAAGGATPGGIMGVTSKSAEKSLRLYNGRGAYNEWTFVAVQRDQRPGGVDGAATPGGVAGRGTPGRGTAPGAARPGGAGQDGRRGGGFGTLGGRGGFGTAPQGGGFPR